MQQTHLAHSEKPYTRPRKGHWDLLQPLNNSSATPSPVGSATAHTDHKNNTHPLPTRLPSVPIPAGPALTTPRDRNSSPTHRGPINEKRCPPQGSTVPIATERHSSTGTTQRNPSEHHPAAPVSTRTIHGPISNPIPCHDNTRGHRCPSETPHGNALHPQPGQTIVPSRAGRTGAIRPPPRHAVGKGKRSRSCSASPPTNPGSMAMSATTSSHSLVAVSNFPSHHTRHFRAGQSTPSPIKDRPG